MVDGATLSTVWVLFSGCLVSAEIEFKVFYSRQKCGSPKLAAVDYFGELKQWRGRPYGFRQKSVGFCIFYSFSAVAVVLVLLLLREQFFSRCTQVLS